MPGSSSGSMGRPQGGQSLPVGGSGFGLAQMLRRANMNPAMMYGRQPPGAGPTPGMPNGPAGIAPTTETAAMPSPATLPPPVMAPQAQPEPVGVAGGEPGQAVAPTDAVTTGPTGGPLMKRPFPGFATQPPPPVEIDRGMGAVGVPPTPTGPMGLLRMRGWR